MTARYLLLRFCRSGFAWGAAGSGNGFGLRRLGGRLHRRIPVEQAAATVAGEQLAVAKLVPGLRAHAHAAAGALLIFGAGDACTARSGNAVEAGEPLGVDGDAEGLARGVERGELGGKFLLAIGDLRADSFEGLGLDLDLLARLGEGGLLRFGPLQACVFLVFEAVSLGVSELQFVLDSRSLLRGLDGVELGAEARCLLPMVTDLAIEARTKRFFAVQGRRGFGRDAFGGGERSLGARDFVGQRAQFLSEAGAAEFDGLQLYEILNEFLHP